MRVKTYQQGPVVQRLENAIHWINHYLVNSIVCSVKPLDSDLSGAWIRLGYPPFEELGS